MENIMPTHKVISRDSALTEFEGTYDQCKDYFDRVGYGLSILKIDEPIYNEDGMFNAIESN